MATLESIRPYVDQLFDDSDVQDQLTRAARNMKVAKARAGKAKSKKKAVQDERLRGRVVAATRNLVAAGQAIKAGPRKQRRRRRGRVLALLAIAVGGAVAASRMRTSEEA
jgi:hypothetical protein